MPSPRKLHPAIGLLTFPGVGEGRNFTTVTVIGVESLTPHGRAGCWNNCITSILVIHLTFGVGSFDGLPFPQVEHLHTTFVPGRWVGGHVEVQFDRCIMKLLMKNCEWKETGASRFLLFARPVNDARYTGCRNTCVATHSDTAENIFLCHPLKLMHRTKQELFQDVHLLFLDDLECYLLSFWPNERTGSTLFSMPILSWSALLIRFS